MLGHVEIRKTIWLFMPLAVIACTSVTDDPTLVGKYDMKYAHTTEKGTRGETCEDGSGEFEVLPTMMVTGRVINTAGQTITHGGARVSGNAVTGDFLMNGQDVGDFSGTLDNGQWVGKYTAINGCSGTWKGRKV